MNASTVHLFVFDTMSDWEYGYLIAGINNPQFQKTPLEFARDVFSALDVYSEQALAAWYSLYKTGDAKYFSAFMKSVDA